MSNISKEELVKDFKRILEFVSYLKENNVLVPRELNDDFTRKLNALIDILPPINIDNIDIIDSISFKKQWW